MVDVGVLKNEGEILEWEPPKDETEEMAKKIIEEIKENENTR